jgi:hypothetical protein
MSLYWYRLCIDVNAEGDPVGISYEVKVAEHRVACHVLPIPLPSRDVHQVLEDLIADLKGRYGVHPPLFS